MKQVDLFEAPLRVCFTSKAVQHETARMSDARELEDWFELMDAAWMDAPEYFPIGGHESIDIGVNRGVHEIVVSGVDLGSLNKRGARR